MRHRWMVIVGVTVAVLAAGATVASFRGSNQAVDEVGSDQQVDAVSASSPTVPPTTEPAPSPTAAAAAETSAPAANRTAPPDDGTCSDVEVVFARGTGERPGLGILGTPLTNNLKQRLPGRTVTSYGVNYAAAQDQSSAGPGATDMSRHIAEVAGRCPRTRFVIGGYSQGGTVTDIAIGLRGASRTTGETIPASLASRVVAVVVFGNPLGLSGRVIETASPTYGPKAKSFCNTDDTVCGGGGAGSLPGSHLSYATNGSVPQAADFAAGQLNS